WTPCSSMPTWCWCWCAARSSRAAGRPRCAPMRACARSTSAGRRSSRRGRSEACNRVEGMQQGPSILEVEGLTAAYRKAQVLFGVSLSLARGETVALMGRNGAGKSTTLKAIMGLLPAAARRLRFAGHDIGGLATYRIARLGLGYVPEDRRIFTDLSVFENLEV